MERPDERRVPDAAPYEEPPFPGPHLSGSLRGGEVDVGLDQAPLYVPSMARDAHVPASSDRRPPKKGGSR